MTKYIVGRPEVYYQYVTVEPHSAEHAVDKVMNDDYDDELELEYVDTMGRDVREWTVNEVSE